MKLNSLILLVATGVALVAIIGFIGPSEGNVVVEQVSPEGVAVPESSPSRDKFRVSKILDFQLYKKLFKKAYKNTFEEVVRRKYFIARAFRAWTSSIKYKWHKSSFYLAINHLSDRSPEEMKRRLTYNSQIDQRDLKIITVVDDTGGTEGTQSGPKFKYINIVPGGLNDIPDWMKESQVSSFAGRDDPSKPDEVFFDHRQSNCLFLPRNQGDCGSCYAFASISIAEWLHCKRTGKLVAFSEQYMVDCGSRAGMEGCSGGSGYEAGTFLNNFGVELRSDYPYRNNAGQCPYDDNADPETMGSVRMGLQVAFMIPLRLVEHFIRQGPMFMAVSTKNGLYEYGGGVIGGAGCEPQPEHAVVLVGHGREDGIEYWLIRNSDGPNWGEAGHFKLAKQSDCIHERFGTLYGTFDGRKFTHSLEKNPLHDPSILEKLQELSN